jgi:hypothetical protein
MTTCAHSVRKLSLAIFKNAAIKTSSEKRGLNLKWVIKLLEERNNNRCGDDKVYLFKNYQFLFKILKKTKKNFFFFL